MRQYGTYFDRNYLLKGLALYRSLEATSEPGSFRLSILCFDPETRDLLGRLRLPHATLIGESELDAFDPVLAAAKRDRDRVEWYWTATPSLPLMLLDLEPGADVVGYLDADLWFLSSPEALHAELGSRSILAVEHGFPPGDPLLRYGRFNVGALLFRRDEHGLGCLRRWREQCLAWCRRVESDGRYGDQKYLDEWPDRWGERLAIARGKGVGLAPWNFHYRRLEGGTPPTADGDPAVYVHFSALAMLSPRLFRITEAYDLGAPARRLLYRPYLRALEAALAEVRSVAPGFNAGMERFSLRRVLAAARHRRLLLR